MMARQRNEMSRVGERVEAERGGERVPAGDEAPGRATKAM